MVQFIRQVLQPEVSNTKKLIINVAKQGDGPPAKVTFSPLTLHVSPVVWRHAELYNSPLERYILAHECGHVILHDGNAKGFSSDKETRVSSVEKFRSAEWQADRFADFLLMPTPVAERYTCAKELGIRSGVPEEMAALRLQHVSEFWLTHGEAFGHDYCSNCLSTETLRIGSRTKCKVCGKAGTLEL